MKENAEKIRIKNIIEMAVMFSAMGRVFGEGSIKQIHENLSENFKEFLNLSSKEDYKEKHKKFCQWFTEIIKTAERKKKDGRIIKKSHAASWGQAAKVIDIVLKVCIYYCLLPSPEISSKILPWLNGAIDTAILKKIKKESPEKFPGIRTLKDIDEANYEALQKIIVEKGFNNEISPVQWEDIIWREQNKRESKEL